jgi:hypothetical protein
VEMARLLERLSALHQDGAAIDQSGNPQA